MTVRTCRRAGFAALTAIIMIGLVGVAMTALGSLLAHQVRRTQIHSDDSQLRQLLLAGAASVSDRAVTWSGTVPKQQWKLSLPEALADDAAEVTVRISRLEEDRSLIARVEAAYAGRSMHQTLVLRHISARWMVVHAAIPPE